MAGSTGMKSTPCSFWVTPRVADRARVNEAPSGIIDIAPTVLDLLELDAPASMRGASLEAADTREVAAPIESFEAGIGSFRQ